MEKVTDVKKLIGFRNPTADEKAGISQIFEIYYDSNIGICKFLAAAGLIIATLLLFIMSRTNPNWVMFACCLLLLIEAEAAFRALKDYENYRDSFENGNFIVLDGCAQKVDENDHNKFINVNFTTGDQIFDSPMFIRAEDYKENMPVILVCTNDKGIYPEIVKMLAAPISLDEITKIRW